MKRWSESAKVRVLQGFVILFNGALLAGAILLLIGGVPSGGWGVAVSGAAVSSLIGGGFAALLVEPGSSLWWHRS